jgi:hypothetical protein
MKKLAIFTLSGLLLTGVSCKKEPLDPGLVGGNRYTYSYLLGECTIAFRAGGAYEIEYGSEGMSWRDEGTYTITGNSITLAPSACYLHKNGEAIDCGKSMGPASCSIRDDADSIYYGKYLVCRSQNNEHLLSESEKNSEIRFPVEKFKVPEGETKKFHGIPVVTMGMKDGIVLKNAKIREKPSVDAKPLTYSAALFTDESEMRPYVPEKTSVKVLARTNDRAKVESWENYWYLINAGVNTEVWMFGEFVEIK